MAPQLSVVIPTKNRPGFLPKALEGLRKQTLPPHEIVVVDDGSDPPVDLSPQQPRVRLLRNPKSLGASASKNQGLEASSGEFIAYFDDDTELTDPTVLKRASDFLVQHENVGAVGFRQLKSDGTPHARQPCSLQTPAVTSLFFSYGCVIRRSVLEAAGGWLEVLGYYYEEAALSMRIIEAGFQVVYEPDMAVVHHEDPDNRDWHRLARLTARNVMLTTLVQFPAHLVVPALARQLYFFAQNGYGSRMSPRDAAWLVTELGKCAYQTINARSPVSKQTIRTFRALRQRPFTFPQARPLSCNTH